MGHHLYTCPPLQLVDSWSPYASDTQEKLALGLEVYERLFSQYPDLVPSFQGVDMIVLSKQVTDILENVVKGFGDMWSVSRNTSKDKYFLVIYHAVSRQLQ